MRADARPGNPRTDPSATAVACSLPHTQRADQQPRHLLVTRTRMHQRQGDRIACLVSVKACVPLSSCSRKSKHNMHRVPRSVAERMLLLSSMR